MQDLNAKQIMTAVKTRHVPKATVSLHVLWSIVELMPFVSQNLTGVCVNAFLVILVTPTLHVTRVGQSHKNT